MIKKILSLSCIASAAALFSQSADAALLITFTEVGNNVQAVTSGELVVLQGASQANFSDELSGTETSLFAVESNQLINVVQSGLVTNSDLLVNPDSSTGDIFGYDGSQLFYGNDVDVESDFDIDISTQVINTITPETTWIWEGVTLADIGLGDLGTTEELVYTAFGTGDTISFVSATAVPEPSSTMLISMGVIGLLIRRSRR